MRKAVIGGAAAAGAALLGAAAIYYFREKETPGPTYRVLRSEGELEIRSYPALTVAETVVQGPRKRALGEGFRRLADYIFAKSRAGEALPMTVPVLQESAEHDTPMFFDDTAEGGWRVRFVMPDGRSEENLPDPPAEIELVLVAERRVGAIRFSGVASDDKLTVHEDLLRGWLTRLGEAPAAEPEYAFYNSPMIPPPLRRCEVLLPLS
ncbi:heme-binding protein [Sphingomonas ginkgonis]|uniref:Heme-binding protein n=1 Tax=Sphingomonas ginkgonis TaxID=2315330 RepID=A0A3R9WR20_9SPHN|nr:heme-binding protein [Sphingomonas ginkgonis]RST29735.1 heme-binding protein [Sphingomonas ginkgonis]